jgi:hypothetical protein
MKKQTIKTVESKEEFCRKVEAGEIERPEEWYIRHPNNPSLYKRVTSVDEACALDEKSYTQEELEEFKRHFQEAAKPDLDGKDVDSEKASEALMKK